MNTVEMLEALKERALKDHSVKQQLFATRNDKDPLDAFCRKCQELGYPVYSMDLINAGEDLCAAMKRSTNGGGENSPMLEWQNDFYELFFAELNEKSERIYE